MFNFRCWTRSRLLRPLVVFSITLMVVLVSPAIAQAFIPAQLPPINLPGGDSPSLPSGVERRGLLESAPVRLDGIELFRIASPAVFNRNEPGGQVPVEIRAKQIEDELERLVQGNPASGEPPLDAATLEVIIETRNNQPVLAARDANLVEARTILTVTGADAQYTGTSQERLAKQWQEILQHKLVRAIELRQPEARRRQFYSATKVLIGTLILTALLGVINSYLGKRREWLKQQLSTETTVVQNQESASVDLADQDPGLLENIRYHFGLKQRYQVVSFLRWLLFWLILLLWTGAIAYSLSTFPQTQAAARTVITLPIVMLVTWFVTGLTNRLVDLTIDRFIDSREQERSLTQANLQRIDTIATVIKGIKMVLLYIFALFWALQWLSLVPGSILTLGAVLALMVSFAVQSLVRDFINGFLILLEDQFRIGDNIKVGEISGMVETLNLRITQLRSDDGSLITLPNSLITQVENRSRGWARADFRIEVAYDTNVDKAMMIVKETIEEMAKDPQWESLIFNTHELFGVDQLSHAGILIRVWIRTAPLKQWSVARELRRRLKIAFDRNNIEIGMPQQLLHNNGHGTSESIRDPQYLDS